MKEIKEGLEKLLNTTGFIELHCCNALLYLERIMDFEGALVLATDCYVGMSSEDDDNDSVPCLFVFGFGITLKNDVEVSIAKEIEAAFIAIAKHHGETWIFDQG